MRHCLQGAMLPRRCHRSSGKRNIYITLALAPRRRSSPSTTIKTIKAISSKQILTSNHFTSLPTQPNHPPTHHHHAIPHPPLSRLPQHPLPRPPRPQHLPQSPGPPSQRSLQRHLRHAAMLRDQRPRRRGPQLRQPAHHPNRHPVLHRRVRRDRPAGAVLCSADLGSGAAL